MIYEERGLDNHKRINGRKRQLLVDTGGRLWRVIVHAANRHDGPAGSRLLEDTTAFDERLEKILGDDAYTGQFAKTAKEKGFVFKKASRAESAKGFVPVTKRWVVERTTARTNFFRRIVKGYENTVQSSAT